MTTQPRSLAATLAVGAALTAIAIFARIAVSEGLLAPNFSAVASAGLFAAAFCGRRWMGAAVPLVAMLASDVILGFDQWQVTLTIYAALIAPGLILGPALARRATPPRIAGAAVGCSLLFFLSTNFAVWAFSGLYQSNGAGLTECFIAAIPFAKYTLAGDLFFAAIFFSAPLAASRLGALARTRQTA